MSRHAEPVAAAPIRKKAKPAATRSLPRAPSHHQRAAMVQAIQLRRARAAESAAPAAEPAAKAPNRTGLPKWLRTGVERLSGLFMGDVRVHRNSAKPAKLGALAYTRGTDIHLGPGQERHLPHEAWHVVQQKQGRVRATTQMKGFRVNEDARLEAEADRMGGRIAGAGSALHNSPSRERAAPLFHKMDGVAGGGVVQRQTSGPRAARQAPQGGAAWTSADFVSHYYFGNGAAVNLATIGLADTFRNHPSVQEQVNGFIQLVLAKPKPGTYVRDETVTDVTNAIFSVGHSTFFRSAYCGPTACGFTFSIRDWFRDPISKGIELGGTPYRINYEWTEARLTPAKK